MMRRLIYICMLACIGAQAQVHRTEFVSFDLRELAEKDNRAGCQYYQELKGGTLNVPVLWLDRNIFVHVESPMQYQPGGMRVTSNTPKPPAGRGTIMVNGHDAGTVTTTPEEFDITPWITDGANKIDLPEGARAWVYSQPKLRVQDYIVDAGLDSLGKHGELKLRVVVANDYNFPETLNVGYDIYSPQGKLLHFDNRDITVAGRSCDTMLFETAIYGMPGNLWTAEKPQLHRCMIVVRRDKRYSEYIPFKVGFGRTTFKDGALVRNGKAVAGKESAFDAAAGGFASAKERTAAREALAKLKKGGVNTLRVERPQPYWFYNLTDELGFYVIDQPETPADAMPNDPRQLPLFMNRAQGAFARSRNHVSVAGWSLGSPHGNGYNLYKTYMWLKEQNDTRPVIYRTDEWNTDF